MPLANKQETQRPPLIIEIQDEDNIYRDVLDFKKGSLSRADLGNNVSFNLFLDSSSRHYVLGAYFNINQKESSLTSIPTTKLLDSRMQLFNDDHNSLLLGEHGTPLSLHFSPSEAQLSIKTGFITKINKTPNFKPLKPPESIIEFSNSMSDILESSRQVIEALPGFPSELIISPVFNYLGPLVQFEASD